MDEEVRRLLRLNVALFGVVLVLVLVNIFLGVRNLTGCG